MGLGAPKRREKLSHDPNNTAWSKSTDSFGHRMLANQGWKPGDYLGADNATHAEHYTAANASHIRVLLREDNLGLGAKNGAKGNAETFGLSTLSGIFGRLNGKSDAEVQKQQDNLRDAELRAYQTQKHGYMNFVSGGLLVGDKIEELGDKKVKAETVDGTAPAVAAEPKLRKKRGAEEDAVDAAPEKRLKRKHRRSDLHAEVNRSALAGSVSTEELRGNIQHGKEASDEASISSIKFLNPGETPSTDVLGSRELDRTETQGEIEVRDHEQAEGPKRQKRSQTASDEKARLKQEKRARKEERRKRKEERRRLRAAKGSKGDAIASGQPADRLDEAIPAAVTTPLPPSLAFGGARHAVRQRYIQQKRLASMDPRALQEILMIKTPV